MSNIEQLKKLRDPFPKNQIGKLPKPTKKQTDMVRADYKKGMRCTICGQWHHKDVVHLDYVGHAPLTDRFLDVDPEWNWKPLSISDNGQPVYDSIGGLWIELTVCGITRLGYGNAGTKKGGDAIKEVIGDALRNAGMRFGAALDLWHKGELHVDDTEEEKPVKKAPKADLTDIETKAIDDLFRLSESKDVDGINQVWTELNQTEKDRVWGKLPFDTQTNINNLWTGKS